MIMEGEIIIKPAMDRMIMMMEGYMWLMMQDKWFLIMNE